MKKLLVLALAGVLSACAGGGLRAGPSPEGEVVEAEGWSPLTKSGDLDAKKRALVEAQKNAVEMVAGVSIAADTRVSNSVIVNQRILAQAAGYIKKYEILSEKSETGFYKIKIRALVLDRKAGEDLGPIRPYPPPGNPSVAVDLLRLPGPRVFSSESAASAVKRELIQHGFSLRGQDSLSQADILIRGSAEAYPLEAAEIRRAGFYSYRARIFLEASRRETGETIYSHALEASAIDPIRKIAKHKALQEAGRLAGKALAKDLYETLSRRAEIF